MKRGRGRRGAAVLALALAACGGGSPGDEAVDPGGGAPDAGEVPDAAATAYADSACGACVAGSCAQEIGWCEEQPACAAWLACVRACPVGSGGDADAACERACPATTETLALRAHAFVSTCRAYGAGATACAACGVDPAAEPRCAILDQRCAPPTSSAPCAACREAHCCETQAAVDADPEATALSACLAACTGWACAKTCAEQHPGGVAEASALSECVAYACPTECYQPPLSACQRCGQEKCANPTCAYLGSERGWLLETCRQACAGDKECQLACREEMPEAVPALETWFACGQVACAEACQ